MWQRVLGKTSTSSIADSASSASAKRKDSDARPRKRSDSTNTTDTTKQQPSARQAAASRGDDRDRGFEPSSTSYSTTSHSAHRGAAAPSVASSYVTAQPDYPGRSGGGGRGDGGTAPSPELVRNPSVRGDMPTSAVSARDGTERLEEMERKERRKEKEGDREKRGERRRERDEERERKGHRRGRSRSEERDGKKSARKEKPKRRNTDGAVEIVDPPAASRAGSDRPRAGAADRFDAQISRPGFNPFPGSQDDSMLPRPPSGPRPAFSPHVPDQFPGQFPSGSDAPYRPPPPGLAADYYGDAGESVAQQPGVRPQAPDLIVGAEPHLLAASAVAAPPPEPSASGGVGASDTFFNSSHTFQTPEGSQAGSARVSPSHSPARPSQGRPAPQFMDQPGSVPGQAEPSASGIVPTLGHAAGGAAAEYYMGTQSSSQHQHSSSVSGQYSSAVQHQYSPGPASTGPAGAYDRPSGSYGPDARPPGSSYDRPSGSYFPDARPPPGSSYSLDSRPPRPGKPHSSSNVPLVAAAAGAAGLAAAAHHHHNGHHNGHSNSYHAPHSSGPGGAGPYGGATATPLAHHARPHRHRGPLGAVVDFFRDPEAVGRFEEYTEYIGVCRGCFEPGSSPRDAPRTHHYGRSPRRRRSGDRLGSSARVDKTHRYAASASSSSSDEGKGRSKKGWLAGGIAGYGLAQVGKSLFGNNRDFDDTYSVKTGRPAGASRENLHVSGRRSPTKRGSMRHGSDAQYAGRYQYGVSEAGAYRTSARPSTDGQTIAAYVDRKPSHGDRRERRESEFGVGDAAIGAALGAVAGGAVAGTHRKDDPRRDAIVRRERRDEPGRPEMVVRRERRGSRGSSSSDRKHRRRRSREDSQTGGGLFGGFFASPPPRDRRGKSRKKKPAKGFFSFSNSSSSSSDSAHRAESSSGRDKRKSSRLTSTKDANAALIGLGATAAALAAAEQRAGKKKRDGSRIIAEEIDKQRRQEHGHGRPHRRRDSDSSRDDGWESASSDGASVDSGLLFGSAASSRASSASSSSARRRRHRRHSPERDSRLGTAAGVAAGAGAAAVGAAYLARDHERPSIAEPPSGDALPPMRHVYPMATDDPAEFDVRPASETSGAPRPPLTARPAAVPLQQPQPVAPIPAATYAAQPHPGGARYTVPSGPPVFDPAVVRDDTPDHRPRVERKDSRRADGVKFDFTREQQDRHDREDRGEKRRAGKERDVVIDVDDPRRAEVRPRKDKDVVVEVEKSPRRQDSSGDERARRAQYEAEIFRLAQQEKPAEEPRLDERGAVVIEPSKSGLSKIGADEYFVDSPTSKEREKRYEARARDDFDEKSARRESAMSSGALAGVVGAAASAAAGAAIVGESRSGKEKAYERERTDRWSGNDIDTRSDASADDMSEERRFARRAAAKIRRSPTPVEHEDYGTFFASAVTDITSRRAGAKVKAGDPDPDDAVVTVQPPSPRERHVAGPEVFSAELYAPFVDPLNPKPWPVPMMGLIRPTPPASREGSYFNSPVVEPETPKDVVEDIEITDVTDEPASKSRARELREGVVEATSVEVPRKTSRVSFGTNETHEYETVSPQDSREELRGARAAGRKDVDDVMEPLPSAKSVDSQSSVEEVKRTHIPGEFDEDPELVATMAAGLQGSGFDPDLVMEDPQYFRRESPPGSDQGSSFYQQPFAETVSDVNFGPGSRWDSPRQHGFVEGEIPDTPKGEKRDIMDVEGATSKKKKSKRRNKDPSFAADEQEEIEQGVRRAYTQDANAELDVIRAASRGPSEDSPDEDVVVDKTKAREGLHQAAEAPITSRVQDVPLEGVKPADAKREPRGDLESLVEAPLPLRDGQALASTSERKEVEDEEDVYESPQEYAASAASAPIGRSDSQSSKKKKKSKRKSSGLDDDRSVVSAPVNAGDRKDSAKKGKKGGILGLFGKSSNEGKESQQPAAPSQEEEWEDTKRKHRKHRKSKEGDDFYSQPAESTPDIAAYPEEESKKSRKAKDKEARRRSRHEDEERGEGRPARERSEKVSTSLPPSLPGLPV